MSFRMDDVSFEDIEEHYWCASLDDLKLIINNEKDTFNATQICEAYGKDFDVWLEASQDCKAEIEDNRSKNELINGYYVNKNLIINIAGWLSPEIRSMVKEIIYCYIIEKGKLRIEEYKNCLENCLENYSSTFKALRKDNIELNRTSKECKEENKNLKKKIKSLSNSLEHEDEASDRAVAVSPSGAHKRESLVKNEQIDTPMKEGEKRYYAIIKKDKYPYLIKITEDYDKTLKYLKKIYPKLEEIFIAKYSCIFGDRKITKNTTNKVTMLEDFMNEMKVKFESRVDINSNEIDLLGEYAECEFLKDVKKELVLNDSPACFTLVLIRKQEYPYNVVRWKQELYNANLQDLRNTYRNLDVLYRILHCDPTSLHQRIRDKLKHVIDVRNWDIKLHDIYSEQKFKDDVSEFVNYDLQNMQNADSLPILQDE